MVPHAGIFAEAIKIDHYILFAPVVNVHVYSMDLGK